MNKMREKYLRRLQLEDKIKWYGETITCMREVTRRYITILDPIYEEGKTDVRKGRLILDDEDVNAIAEYLEKKKQRFEEEHESLIPKRRKKEK